MSAELRKQSDHKPYVRGTAMRDLQKAYFTNKNNPKPRVRKPDEARPDMDAARPPRKGPPPTDEWGEGELRFR